MFVTFQILLLCVKISLILAPFSFFAFWFFPEAIKKLHFQDKRKDFLPGLVWCCSTNHVGLFKSFLLVIFLQKNELKLIDYVKLFFWKFSIVFANKNDTFTQYPKHNSLTSAYCNFFLAAIKFNFSQYLWRHGIIPFNWHWFKALS